MSFLKYLLLLVITGFYHSVCSGQTTIRVQDQFLEIAAVQIEDSLHLKFKNISKYSTVEKTIYVQGSRFQQNPSSRVTDSPVRIKNYSTPGHTPLHLSCIKPDAEVNVVVPVNNTQYCLDIIYLVEGEFSSKNTDSATEDGLIVESWYYLVNGLPLVVCNY